MFKWNQSDRASGTLGYGRPLVVLKAGSSRCPSSLAMCSSSSRYHGILWPRCRSRSAITWAPRSPLGCNKENRPGGFRRVRETNKQKEGRKTEAFPSSSHPRTLMLVSNTDTTTSLSSRTSLSTFLTASSNSSSLFKTYTHTRLS